MPDGRMRVLFVIGSLEIGGTERQLVQILRRLDRSRFEPYLYTIYKQGELLREVPADVPIDSYWEGRTARRWCLPGRTLCDQGRDLARSIRARNIDLVCDRNFNVALPAADACGKCRTPRVSVVECDPRSGLRSNVGGYPLLKRWWLKSTYHKADRVVAVSQAVAEGVRAIFRIPDSKLCVIHNFVELVEDARPGVPAVPLTASAASGEPFEIVFVGRFQEEKGLTYLLTAMDDLVHRRSLKRLRLSLVGKGPLENTLRQQVVEKNLADVVRFEGFQAQPGPFLMRARLFCLPSLFEGLPVALIEAMAAGTPVLATDSPGGNREPLDHGEYGTLVPTRDPRALADAIEDAVRNEPTWRERARRGQAFIRSHFSAEVGVRRYEELFQDVLAERTRGTA